MVDGSRCSLQNFEIRLDAFTRGTFELQTLHVLQNVAKLIINSIGLKRMVNLPSGYPDANIYGYPVYSDIIKLVLLAIYFKFITTNLTYST